KRAVRRDPIQPRTQRRLPAKGLPPPPGTQQRLLDDIFSVLQRAEHAIAMHLQLAPEAAGRRRKGLAVAAQRARPQLALAQARASRRSDHAGMTVRTRGPPG